MQALLSKLQRVERGPRSEQTAVTGASWNDDDLDEDL